MRLQSLIDEEETMTQRENTSTNAASPPQTTPAAAGAAAGHIHTGMEVYGANGGLVGRVKEVHDADIWVDRTLQRDIYVPLTAIQEVANGQVFLNVLTGHVGDMGWDRPIVTGQD